MPLAHTSSQPIPYSPWVHEYSNLGPLVRRMTRWTSWGLPILEAFPHHRLSSPLLSGAVVQLQNTSTYQTNPFMNQNQLVSSFINWPYKIPSMVTRELRKRLWYSKAEVMRSGLLVCATCLCLLLLVLNTTYITSVIGKLGPPDLTIWWIWSNPAHDGKFQMRDHLMSYGQVFHLH